MHRLTVPLLLTGSLLLVACGGGTPDVAEPAGVTAVGAGFSRAAPTSSAADVQGPPSGVAMAGSHGPTGAVDRPFLFLVRDEPTGAVLFLGRVMDPR